MPRTLSDLKALWPIPATALTLNLTLFAVVAVMNPQYLSDYHLSGNPDGIHYVRLGRNIFLHGEYSRKEAAPFVPDMLRTPVYPLFAGGLDILGHAGLIYFVQILLHAASCLMLALLVSSFIGRRPAIWAGMLMALDPVLITANFWPMSEGVFIFFTLAALLALEPMLSTGDPRAVDWKRAAGGGVLLAAATLTRPAGLYLPFILAAIVLVVSRFRQQGLAVLRHVAIFLLLACVPVAAWITRNAIVLGVPHLSTAETVVTVYFLGAGGYQLHYGVSLEQAQEQISREFQLPPPLVLNNPWTTALSVSEMDEAMRAATPRVLLKFPRDTIAGGLLGMAKASISHNTDLLGSAIGRPWQAPGMGTLVHGDLGSFSKRISENHPLLAASFFLSLLHRGLLLTLAGLFVLLAWKDPHLRGFGRIMLPIACYFYMMVAMDGVEAYWRFQQPVVPFLCALGGATLAHASSVWRVRSSDWQSASSRS